MRKAFLFLCITTCFGSVFSQNRFYLRPVIETLYCKASRAQTLLNPAWFEYKTKPYLWTRKADIGIMLGYQFNKKRTCIEAGIGQARAAFGWELSFLEYTPSTAGTGTYTRVHLNEQDGVKGIKIPVLLTTQLFYWDSLKLNKSRDFSLHCNFIIGISIHRQKYKGILHKASRNYMLSPGTLLNVHSYTYSGYAPHTVLPETGFSLELRKRQKEWATLTFYCLLRVGRHGSFGKGQVLIMDITDISTNQITTYGYGSSSLGNGLLVEISKKLFYPKRKREPKFIKD
jgi:hypothetical protein